nr:ATP-dependent DNA helicase DDM1 isoform X1 [Ipomoea batatas]GMC98671.1 ATP-dependent DNA helicase DDM1 isoform X1 [Ipomoea batatas]
METGDGDKNKPTVDSPTSVLEDEEEAFIDAKNGDSSNVSQSMLKEEEILSENPLKEEEEENDPNKTEELNETQFSRLDELLTQTQLYSEFLFEKMDDITVNAAEEDEDKTLAGNKRGRGRKKKATYNNASLFII